MNARILITIAALTAAGCQVRTTPPAQKEGASPATSPVTGFDVKALFLTGSDQPEFSMASYRGRVLVLDFWATWSQPSQADVPALNQLAQGWDGQGVSLVGMAVDRGDRTAIADAVKLLNLSYPVAWADDNVQSAFGGIRAVPTKVLVDKKGQIRKQIAGVVSAATLRDEVNALLAEN